MSQKRKAHSMNVLSTETYRFLLCSLAGLSFLALLLYLFALHREKQSLRTKTTKKDTSSGPPESTVGLPYALQYTNNINEETGESTRRTVPMRVTVGQEMDAEHGGRTIEAHCDSRVPNLPFHKLEGFIYPDGSVTMVDPATGFAVEGSLVEGRICFALSGVQLSDNIHPFMELIPRTQMYVSSPDPPPTDADNDTFDRILYSVGYSNEQEGHMHSQFDFLIQRKPEDDIRSVQLCSSSESHNGNPFVGLTGSMSPKGVLTLSAAKMGFIGIAKESESVEVGDRSFPVITGEWYATDSDCRFYATFRPAVSAPEAMDVTSVSGEIPFAVARIIP